MNELNNLDNITLEDIKAAKELSPSTWVEGMVNESGFPIEFDNHKFMEDIYDDISPYQVILKAPQVGATTMNVLKALWVASHLNKQIIYTLPTVDAMRAMVSSGFNRLIAQNSDLQKLVVENDTMEHKQVGEGIIRFRGAATGTQAMMVPSDLNIHDEVDASDPMIITQYETRLQAKADGWRWYFSHPSLIGQGVDVYWQQSDQKEWYVNPSCRHAQQLTWPESIVNERYVCKKCATGIDIEDIKRGAWQVTAQGSFSGYHISQLMCPWISPQKIVEAYHDPLKDKKYFYNYVLGLPYADSDDIITKEQVLQNVTDEFNSQEDRVIIGCDTGNLLHYVLMNQQGVFNFGATEPPHENYDPYLFLEGLLRRWPRSVIVFDAQGDIIGPQQLQVKYPGRVYRCWYGPDRKSMETIKWGEKDKIGEVTVDRERMMSLIVEQLRDNRFKLNGSKEEWTPFAEHFANMVRMDRATDDEKRRGITKYKWEKNGGRPDHWAHALLYAMVGFDRFRGEPEVADISWLSTPTAIGPDMTFDQLKKLRS